LEKQAFEGGETWEAKVKEHDLERAVLKKEVKRIWAKCEKKNDRKRKGQRDRKDRDRKGPEGPEGQEKSYGRRDPGGRRYRDPCSAQEDRKKLDELDGKISALALPSSKLHLPEDSCEKLAKPEGVKPPMKVSGLCSLNEMNPAASEGASMEVDHTGKIAVQEERRECPDVDACRSFLNPAKIAQIAEAMNSDSKYYVTVYSKLYYFCGDYGNGLSLVMHFPAAKGAPAHDIPNPRVFGPPTSL